LLARATRVGDVPNPRSTTCSARLVEFALPFGDAGRRRDGLAVMGLVIGVAHFALVWASLRLLFPEERSKQKWGLVLAAALPPLLYLSQYVSNEGLPPPW